MSHVWAAFGLSPGHSPLVADLDPKSRGRTNRSYSRFSGAIRQLLWRQESDLHRGAGSGASARAYASTVITAAFSFNSGGSTLSKVSAAV
jgi:hypothetical protein